MSTAQADFQNKQSFAYKARRKRLAYLLEVIDAAPKPLTILDVGGTDTFWKMMDLADQDNLRFTILNIFPAEEPDDRFEWVVGDARDLSQFGDGSFDLVFSNSVIEHVGGPDDQRRMAEEIRRVGRRYFVQTPNRYFPIEPHFLFPGFQFLPERTKVFLLKRFQLGWYPKAKTDEEAVAFAREIRLLSRREFASLFPDARLIDERLAGLVKSFMAVRA
jgi:SAM-dependent methyltransferase